MIRAAARLRHPYVAGLAVKSFDRGSRHPVGYFLTIRIPPVGVPCVVEGFTIDGLGVRRQMPADRPGKVAVRWIRHNPSAIPLVETMLRPQRGDVVGGEEIVGDLAIGHTEINERHELGFASRLHLAFHKLARQSVPNVAARVPPQPTVQRFP